MQFQPQRSQIVLFVCLLGIAATPGNGHLTAREQSPGETEDRLTALINGPDTWTVV